MISVYELIGQMTLWDHAVAWVGILFIFFLSNLAAALLFNLIKAPNTVFGHRSALAHKKERNGTELFGSRKRRQL